MKVYELLATPDKWTQGEWAKDDKGKEVNLNSEMACCWCLDGALMHCYKGDEYFDVCARINKRTNLGIITWNDAPTRTHVEVLALCKELDI